MCVCFTELKIGKKLHEGKTKQILELEGESGVVLVQSKDQITAGNAVRKDQMEGKAAIANKTTSSVFKLLHDSGEDTFIGFDRYIPKVLCCCLVKIAAVTSVITLFSLRPFSHVEKYSLDL